MTEKNFKKKMSYLVGYFTVKVFNYNKLKILMKNFSKSIFLISLVLVASCQVDNLEELELDPQGDENPLSESSKTVAELRGVLTAQDIDQDGINDYADADTNGDGTVDNGTDTDGDGINDDADADADGDGVLDEGAIDTDGDGIKNTHDDDIDGDGLQNDEDDDIDGDGIANEIDNDMDGDGYSNDEDEDEDGDGFLNNEESQNTSLNALNDAVAQAIQAYLDENYPNLDVRYIKIYPTFIKVKLSNRTELYFDYDGQILYVDDHGHRGSGEEITFDDLDPEVAQRIQDYIANNHPDDMVDKLERYGELAIKVKLESELRLFFDGEGNFLGAYDGDFDYREDNRRVAVVELEELDEAVAANITAFLNENHPESEIKRILKLNDYLRVKLNPRKILYFDLEGNFIRYGGSYRNGHEEISFDDLDEEVRQRITDYLIENYPDNYITDVEIKFNFIIGIKLDNDVVLFFDRRGNLILEYDGWDFDDDPYYGDDEGEDDDYYYGEEETLSEFAAFLGLTNWSVSSYIDDGVDQTTDFENYILSFADEGVFQAVIDENTTEGMWSVGISSSRELELVLDLGEVAPLGELSDSWVVKSLTDNSIELIDVSGGDGSVETLVIQRVE